MYFEFKALLELAAKNPIEAEVEALCGGQNVEDFRQLLIETLPPNFSILECPPKVGAAIGANIAFVWAREINDRKAANFPGIDAELLAMLVINSANCLGGKSFFSLVQGQKGYVNGTPTEVFKLQFISSIEELGATCLFKNASFVCFPEDFATVPAQSLGVDLEELFTRAASCSSKGESEIFKILKRITDSTELVVQDVVMLLALMDDAELDVDPYLWGLQSKQNVPWYFNYFMETSGRLLRAWESENGPSEGEHRAVSEKVDSPFQLEVDRFRGQSIELLLNFRNVYFNALYSGCPERFIGHLRKIAASFISFFNLPQVRASIIPGPGPVDRLTKSELSRLVSVLQSAVRAGLDAIEFSCEK